MTRKRYADTLEAIARYGAGAFYEGPIAAATIRAIQAANGTMVIADLHNYTITHNVAPQISYRGYNISSCGLPSGGDVVLSIMKTLEGYGDIGHAATVNISTFRMDEAIRFAYGEVSTQSAHSVYQG